jgi:hypothetical protein
MGPNPISLAKLCLRRFDRMQAEELEAHFDLFRRLMHADPADVATAPQAGKAPKQRVKRKPAAKKPRSKKKAKAKAKKTRRAMDDDSESEGSEWDGAE